MTFDPTDTFDIELADPGGGNPVAPALLITPHHNLESTLLEFPTTGRTLDWYYQHIDCTCITCVTPMADSLLGTLARKHGVALDMWGDDEGLLIHEPILNRTICLLSGYPGPLVGNWILLTTTEDGDSRPLPLPLYTDLIKYLPLIPSDTSVD